MVGPDPPSGAKLGRGGKVTVTVSAGRPEVPSLSGLNVEKATAGSTPWGSSSAASSGPAVATCSSPSPVRAAR